MQNEINQNINKSVSGWKAAFGIEMSLSLCSLRMSVVERHIQEVDPGQFFNASWHCNEAAGGLLV